MISSSLAAIGVALDKLILPDQAKLIQNYLSAVWIKIDDMKISDLPKKTATSFLVFERNIFGDPKDKPYKWFLVTLIISLLLTTTAIAIGDIIQSYNPIYQTISFSNIFASIKGSAPFIVYPFNLICDLLTFYITIFILRKFIATKSAIYRVLLILFDVFIAYIFVLLCFYIPFPSATGGFSASLFNLIDAHETFIIVLENIKDFNPYDLNLIVTLFFTSFIYSLTSFIPTIFYLLLLTILTLSYMSFHIAKFIVQQVLRLSVDTDKSVFFYTGTVLGVFTMGIKLISEV